MGKLRERIDKAFNKVVETELRVQILNCIMPVIHAELEAALRQQTPMTADGMLEAVIGSLRMYPNGCGDIRVMAEVDRLIKEGVCLDTSQGSERKTREPKQHRVFNCDCEDCSKEYPKYTQAEIEDAEACGALERERLVASQPPQELQASQQTPAVGEGVNINLRKFMGGLAYVCRTSTHPEAVVREQLGAVAGLIEGALASQPDTPPTPREGQCNGPFGDEESCPVHGEEIRRGRGRAAGQTSGDALERASRPIREEAAMYQSTEYCEGSEAAFKWVFEYLAGRAALGQTLKGDGK